MTARRRSDLVASPLLLVWLACSGCSGLSDRSTSYGGVAPSEPQSIHRIEVPLAPEYGRQPKVTLSEFEARVLETLQEAAGRAGRQPPQTDGAAQKAAREICRALPAEGPPPSALVDFALRSHGLVDPPPHMVIADVPAGSEALTLRQLADRFRRIFASKAMSRVGIGLTRPERTPTRRRVVVALLENRVRFVPFPRVWTLGQQVRLQFSVAPSYQKIKMMVTSPDGRVAPTSMRRSGDRWLSPLQCAKRGVYQVEVTGEGRYGVEVLANFPVFCGRRPPRQIRFHQPSRELGSVGELEREILERTNQIRRRTGLVALLPDEHLARVARDHSHDMRKNDFVGHLSPTTGQPSDRLNRAGIVFQVVRENVARAYSPTEVMNELMNSPAHRDNIVGRDVTHIGVGIAVDRSGTSPALLVTQVFIKPGRRYDPSSAVADILRIVRKSRQDSGVPPLRVDRDLEQLARRFVKTVIAHNGDPSLANSELSRSLRRLGGRFNQVEGLTLKLVVLDSMAQAEELRRKRHTHLGLGVGQLRGQLIVFLLLGSRR